MMNDSANPNHIGDTRMTTQSVPPPSLAPKTAQRTSLGHRLQRALTGGPNRRFTGLHSPLGGTASPSLLLNRRLAFPILALLALLTASLLFLLPGGPAWAQDDGTIEYPENGTGTVATYVADDPEGTAIAWTLEGDDASDFRISPAGVLTFAVTPNYEASTGGGASDNDTSPTYAVTVVATDSSYDADVSTTAGKDTEDVTVTVTNVDEDGTLTLSNRQPVDGVELLTELTDIDSVENDLSDLTAQTWKWEKSTSRSSGWTVIDGATDAMYTPEPDDIVRYLRVTVTYTDPQGSGKTEMAVSDKKVLAERSTNTAPVFRNADDKEIEDGTAITREVPENSDASTNVGARVAAYDAEGDALTYTISGGEDEDSFDIDQATGQLMVGAKTMLDFEGDSSYTVMVTATGPRHGTDDFDTIEVTITVTNVDEDPGLTGMDSLRPAENTVITGSDASLGTYVASDDEDGSNLPALTLSGPDASDFNLTDTNAADGRDDDGTYELAFKAVPDYEMAADTGRNNVYNITVTATDSDGQTDTKDVVVTVTNVEEAGTVTLNTLQPRVGIGVMATLTDLDGATSGVTWAWEGANGTDDCSSVTFAADDTDDLEGGISGTYTPTADDVSKCLRATASYTDPQGSDTAMSELTASDQPVEEDDTNKAPAFPDLDTETDGDQKDQEKTVAENTVAGEEIGAAVDATDPNEDNLTYTLGGTDMASFGIDRGTGQLMTKAALNKEDKDTYVVTVTATDPSGLSDTINVTIKVTNVDEDPEITGGDTSVRYAENRADAVETYTATDDEDDRARTAITWTLEGDDASDFRISPAGVLTFAVTPNYEASTGGGASDNDTSPTYAVTVVATDSSYDADVSTTAGKDTEDVTVTVTNVDEDGTLTLSNRQPVDGVELLTELTDIDSVENDLSDLTAQTWKWEKSTSRSSGWTVIDGATDAMYTPEPDDIVRYLRVTVTYTDPQGSGKTEMAVSDKKVLAKRSTNTAPVFRNADDKEIEDGTAITREVPENSDASTNVGARVAAYDAEGDALTYTISGGEDEDSFDIDQATGQLMVGAKTMLDFEGDSSYTVMVTATGPRHGTDDFDTIEVTITVTNVDEDPGLTGMDSLRPAENTVITGSDASLGTYVASDDEDGSNLPALTLSGPDASDFNLTDTNAADGRDDDGTYELAFKAVPDYEMAADTGRNNVYNITVTATDSDGQTDTKDVVVTVTNVEEAGTVTLNTLQPRVGIGVMATLTDLDGATSGVTWAWEGANGTDDCSSVTFAADDTDDLEGGISGTYTPTADDVSKCLRATVSYTDPQGSDTAMSELTASDQPVEEDDTNKAPAFPDLDTETDGDQKDQEKTVAENTVAGEEIGAAVDATDPNEDNLTYTLGGTDMASFGIDRGTGQLMTKAALNKEDKDTYVVTVTATDPSGLSDTINVTIKVTNVDEDPEISRRVTAVGNVAPEFADDTTSRTVVEGTAAGADIGAPVTAEDPDVGDALTYTLGGTDAASFNIVRTTGQLQTKADLDYETKASYDVTVTATDGNTASDSIDVTITVTDVVDESVAPADPLKDKYDANDNDEIERSEVFAAINDYLDGGAGAPTRADVFKLIELYLGD